MSAAGSLPYLSGIGGFLVDLAFAAISVGVHDPLPDLVGAQLRADTVERVRLVALAGDGMADLALLRGVDFLSAS